MSLNEQVRAMRDPEFRAQLGGFLSIPPVK